MKKLGILITMLVSGFIANAQWTAFGSGMNGIVEAVCVYGGNLYATGQFTTAGGTLVNNIAYWDGTKWNACGTGLAGGGFSGTPTGYALRVFNGKLIVGGQFTSVNGLSVYNIAQWNGTTWSKVGASGTTSQYDQIQALTDDGGTNLYIGGLFSSVGGVSAGYVARYNSGTNTWYVLGSGGYPTGGFYGQVNSLTYSGGDLYVGANGTPYWPTNSTYLGIWNGATWTPVGTCTGPLSGSIDATCAWGGNVYMGGWFTVAAGTTVDYVAKYNGVGFSALSTGTNNIVTALSTFSPCTGGNYLAVSGQFGSPYGYMGLWNGSAWTWPAGGSNALNNFAVCMCTYNNLLVAGGGFNATADGSVTLNDIGGLSCGIILPITLESFTVKCENNSALLQWATATETNNDHFTIERSTDGVNYQTLATVKGSGNSSTTRDYSLIDDSPLSGISYYRLSQTDVDGTTANEGTISYTTCQNSNVINAYCTFGNNVSVQINSSRNDIYTINLINTLGQMVYSTSRNVSMGENNFNLNQTLAEGIYIIQITGQENTFTKKLLLGNFTSR